MTVIGKKAVLALIAGGVFALTIANMFFFTNFKTTSSLAFTEGAIASAFDGDLMLVVSYDAAGYHIIYIYGYDHEPSITFSKTDLIEVNSGIKIPSRNIELKTTPLSSNISTQNPILLNFSVVNEAIQAGVYRGILFITSSDSTASIPITYDVKPDLSRPIILVVDGIVISVVLWKLITYFNTKYPKVVIKAQGDPITFARVDITQNIWEYLKESSKKPIIIKNLILDIGTIIFGIGLGIVGLPTNDFINNLYNISAIDVLILISIGLGIGSLKEFVDKQVVSKYQ